MPSLRFRLSMSSQILLAVVLGILAAGGLSVAEVPFGVKAAVNEVVRVIGGFFLAGGQLLAIPLVISSAMESLVGLEAMRGLGRMIRRVAWCFFGTGALTVASGWLLVGVCHLGPPLSSLPLDPNAQWFDFGWQAKPQTLFFWPALVAVGIGLGFYRNQIGEGRAHLLLRFWRGVNDALLLLVTWVQRLVPIGVFFLVGAGLTRAHLHPLVVQNEWVALEAVLLVWAVYAVLVLPATLWLITRMNPWKYARLWLSVVLTAGASGCLPATLPISLGTIRQRTGISARVAGIIVPLGAAVWRDGAILGWVVLAMLHARAHHPRGENLVVVLLALKTGVAVMIGGGFGNAAMPMIVLSSILDVYTHGGLLLSSVLSVAVFIELGGAAVSQWSVACVAAVLAHWEGESDLLTPKPPADPFFGERLSKDFI